MKRARVLVSLLTVVATLATFTGMAHAAGRPEIVFFPPGDLDLGNLNDGPTGPVCDFPVGVVVHNGRADHGIIFDGHPSGYAVMVGGNLSQTITNLDTGKSVTVNISGPGWLNGDFLPVTGRGPWTIFEPISEGGIRFFHGVMRFVPSPYGVHAILIHGTEENLCDRVA
jgi:hypothetical protein